MKRTAFSLVELLVVIAIISVLAAMLLPTLEQALETTRRALCASNLKQVGYGNAVYMNDHAEWMPTTSHRWYGGAPLIPTVGFWAHWQAAFRSQPASYYGDIWPAAIRDCPSTPWTEAIRNSVLPTFKMDNSYVWGYATPMLFTTPANPDPAAVSYTLDTEPAIFMSDRSWFTVLGGSRYPLYLRPLRTGLARKHTGEVFTSTAWWTGGNLFDPSDTAPMAADRNDRCNNPSEFFSHNGQAPDYQSPWNTAAAPAGGNSVWGDGHVQWNPWTGNWGGGYAIFRMSGREPDGWTMYGNSYFNAIFWARNGKK